MKKETQSIWRYGHIGIYFGMIVGGFTYLGKYIEERFQIQPWGMLIGALLGLGFGIFRMLLYAKEIEQEWQDSSSSNKDESQ